MEPKRKRSWHACRLVLHRESGRVRWCFGEEKQWRSKTRFLSLVPAFLLPIVVICIIITQLDKNVGGESVVISEIPPNYDSEFNTVEDKEVSYDLKTSYIPSKIRIPLESHERQRREIKISAILYDFNQNETKPTGQPKIPTDQQYSHLSINPKLRKQNISIGLDNQNVNLTEWTNNSQNPSNAIPPTFSTTNTTDFNSEVLKEVNWKISSLEIRRGSKKNRNPDIDKSKDFLAWDELVRGISKEKVRETQAKVMLKYMDRTVDPCEDFYSYSCGKWSDYNSIPSDRSSFDTFEQLRERLDVVLKNLLEENLEIYDELEVPDNRLAKLGIGKYINENADLKVDIVVKETINRAKSKTDTSWNSYSFEEMNSEINETNQTSDLIHKASQTKNNEENRNSGGIVANNDEITDMKGQTKSEIVNIESKDDHKIITSIKEKLGIGNGNIGSGNDDSRTSRMFRKQQEPDAIVSEETGSRIDEITIRTEGISIKNEAIPFISKAIAIRSEEVDTGGEEIGSRDVEIGTKSEEFFVNQEMGANVLIANMIGAEGSGSFEEQTNIDEENNHSLDKVVNSIGRTRSQYTSKSEDVRNYKRTFQETAKPSKKTIKRQTPKFIDAVTKAKYFYKSCMNEEVLNKRGERPLLDLMKGLGGWPAIDPYWNEEKFDLTDLLGTLRLYNNDIFFSEWVGPDFKQSDEYVIQFDQGALALPDREYFIDSGYKKFVDAYRTYIIKTITLLGAPLENATKDADEIIQLETKVAKIMCRSYEKKNLTELYQRFPLEKMQTFFRGINWERYVSIVLEKPVNRSIPIVIYCMSYLEKLTDLLAVTPKRTVANYALWRFARHRASNLDYRFEEAKNYFYNIIFGRDESPPRWKGCVAQVNAHLGMALGNMFVTKYFDETSRNDTIQMTVDLQEAFREILEGNDWLDSETKTTARGKIDAMRLRIGYPDFVLEKERLSEKLKNLTIHPDYYFENTLNILVHVTRMEKSKLGTPVNKNHWNTAPAIVNAYYSRNKNQILFPAGILQPPFYHRHFPKALNYGGIGVVIGHEITHGFDDRGRLFDQDGNMQDWWNVSAVQNFVERTQCLIDQYNRFVVPEVNINLDGSTTNGENIADNGGIKQAFMAYQRWTIDHPEEDESLPGLNLTNNQLFFLNFAQIWCGAMKPEVVKNKLRNSVHAPGRFRVIGSLSNSAHFSQVFNCSPGTPMNPKHKCSLW